MKKRFPNRWLFCVFCFLALPIILKAQTDSPVNSWLHSYRYGMAGGVTVSGFSRDSVGYSKQAMPFGGFYINLGFTPNASVSLSALYTIKGILLNSPYVRYRYHYISPEISLRYRVIDFLQVEAGYRYPLSIMSQKVILNGGQASGSERLDIPGMGNYGQFIVGGIMMFGTNTDLTFRYGIPNRNIPFSHYQIGVCVHLNDRIEKNVKEISAKQQARQLASRQAIELHEGILLVRLLTMQNTLDALQKAGEFEKARQVKAMVNAENQKIIEAFDAFKFTKVYFFYDRNTPKVMEGKLDSVLMDKQLNLVPVPQYQGLHYIAEFGQYQSDQRSYQVRRDPQYLIENNIALDSTAAWISYADKGLGIGGLVVMNSQFVTLDAPFPTFTPITNKTLFKDDKKYEKAVIRLDEALTMLYYKD